MARNNGNPQQMFLLVTDDTQSTSVQINSEGQAKLLDPQTPKKDEDEDGDNGITFYNEKGEVERGVLLSDFHFFVNENNEVFSVPPGSIVQGRFKVVNKHFPITPETTGEESSVELAPIDVVPTTPDSTTAQIMPIDSNKMEYASMEDIELEEEIISNSDLRSSDSEQRSTEVKGSQRQTSRSRSKSKRRKKSVSFTSESRRKSKENQSMTVNQSKQLMEMSEAELLTTDTTQSIDNCQDSINSSLVQVQHDDDNDEDDKSIETAIEDHEVISCSTDKVTNNIAEPDLRQNSNKLQNNPPSPGNSNEIRETQSDFMKSFVEEIINKVAENASEHSENTTHDGDIVRSNQDSGSPEAPCENGQAGDICLEAHGPADPENVDETPSPSKIDERNQETSSPSRIENEKDHEMCNTSLPNESASILEETFPPDADSISCSSQISQSSGNVNITLEDICASSTPKPFSDDHTSFQDVEPSGPLFPNLNESQQDNNSSNMKEMVDKSVQVLLSNFKVIRVTQDWGLPVKKANESMSRDVTRQRKELDDRLARLQAMEREFEIRNSFLTRELSKLEMKRRAFDVEMARERQIISRAKDEVDFAWRRIHQKPNKQTEDKNKVVQSTPTGRQRKRKSDVLPEITPPAKKTPRSRLSRANGNGK